MRLELLAIIADGANAKFFTFRNLDDNTAFFIDSGRAMEVIEGSVLFMNDGTDNLVQLDSEGPFNHASRMNPSIRVNVVDGQRINKFFNAKKL